MVPAFRTGSIGRAAFAIALSAAVAVAIAQSSRAPVGSADDDTPAVAIGAEHETITAFVEQDALVEQAVAREADAAIVHNRVEALQPAKMPAPKPAKPRIVAAAPSPAPQPVALTAPLPLQPPQLVQSAAPRKPVIARVVSTVERVPEAVSSGVRDAFHWLTDLPREALSHLPPERRFL